MADVPCTEKEDAKQGEGTVREAINTADLTELTKVLSQTFACFGIDRDDATCIADEGMALSQELATLLYERVLQATQGQPPTMRDVAPVYVAVHVLFTLYNTWLHAELEESTRRRQAHVTPAEEKVGVGVMEEEEE